MRKPAPSSEKSRIAALDLELRGAGNLLGGQQSGHIQAVGLDLYVKLLERAILELRGEAVDLVLRPTHPPIRIVRDNLGSSPW